MKKTLRKLAVLLLIFSIISCSSNIYYAADDDVPTIYRIHQDEKLIK